MNCGGYIRTWLTETLYCVETPVFTHKAISKNQLVAYMSVFDSKAVMIRTTKCFMWGEFLFSIQYCNGKVNENFESFHNVKENIPQKQ